MQISKVGNFSNFMGKKNASEKKDDKILKYNLLSFVESVKSEILLYNHATTRLEIGCHEIKFGDIAVM